MERLCLFTCIAVAIIMLKSTPIGATVKITSCGEDNTILVSESAKKFTVTLERTGDLTKSDYVLISTYSNTARPDRGDGDGDYADTNIYLFFQALTSTLVYDIIINDDSEVELDETFAILVKNYSDHNVNTLDRCEVTILDNECIFYVIGDGRSDPVTVAEGSGVTELNIGRKGNVDRSATIYVKTSSVNSDSLRDAISGEDYAALSTFVTFPPGVDTIHLTLTINDDDKPEITEYLNVSLSDGHHCNKHNALSFCSVVIGIKDNDETIVRMRDTELTVNEDVGTACPILYRTGSLSRIDVVSLSVMSVQTIASSPATRGSDFLSASPLSVTFEQDEDEQRACIVVFDDTLEELGVESLLVGINGTKHIQAHQDPSSLPARIDKVNQETILYIRDDDGTFQLSCPRTRISESEPSVTCMVVRTGPYTDTQIAYVSTRNGKAISLADYEKLSSKLFTFVPDMAASSFGVKLYNDKALEGSEDFYIYLADDSGIDLGQREEIITIIDDDNRLKFGLTPETSPIDETIITMTESVIVSESVGTVNLTIQREAYGCDLPSGTTSVRVRSREIAPDTGFHKFGYLAYGNGVDYVNVYKEVTFQIGQTRVDVQVEIEDDELIENQEAFEITLSHASPEANNYVWYPYLVTVYINDDDGGENGRNDLYKGVEIISVALLLGGIWILAFGFIVLIRCRSRSCWRKAFVDTPRVVSPPPRIFGGVSTPLGPPPSYHTTNPTRQEP